MSSPDTRPTLEDRLSRRPTATRTLLVLLPLLLGLVVAALIGGRLLWKAVDSASPEEPSVTCWDGNVVGDSSGCGAPSGKDGLAWVFPSFRPERDDCRDELLAHPEYRRPTMWSCATDLRDRPVTITYSEVSSVSAAVTYFDGVHGADERTLIPAGGDQDARYVWPTSRVDGGWATTVLLQDRPFAVTVQATSRSDATRALARMVTIRDSDQLRVRPTATTTLDG